MFKAHRLLYHSTLGLRVIKKNKKKKKKAQWDPLWQTTNPSSPTPYT